MKSSPTFLKSKKTGKEAVDKVPSFYKTLGKCNVAGDASSNEPVRRYSIRRQTSSMLSYALSPAP